MKKDGFIAKVCAIQQALKAPKGQFNKFGGYAYRSCEDILNAVKPLLNGLVLTLDDQMEVIGQGENQRFYVKTTAGLSDGENTFAVSALAREPENRKGMDASQITGACSSYARKYALNGLFLIDDTKDADHPPHVIGKATPPEKQTPPIKDPPKTPPAKNEVSEKELRTRITKMLLFISGNDKEKAIAGLKSFSSFTDSEGKVVEGKSKTSELTGDWLRSTYGKIKHIYENFEGVKTNGN